MTPRIREAIHILREAGYDDVAETLAHTKTIRGDAFELPDEPEEVENDGSSFVSACLSIEDRVSGEMWERII
jgi:hypothetical protein